MKKVLNCEIPQGSVLGPFQILLYINDLSNTSYERKVTMFGDETTVINAGKEFILSSARTLQKYKNDQVVLLEHTYHQC